jgi:hypothetical protein
MEIPTLRSIPVEMQSLKGMGTEMEKIGTLTSPFALLDAKTNRESDSLQP